jgi:hypothetical protein
MVEKWVRKVEATYNRGDQFKRDMESPLCSLMLEQMHAGQADQAVATGRRILGLQPDLLMGSKLVVHMMITYMYIRAGQSHNVQTELRAIRDLCWKMAGISLRQLKVVAKQAMEMGDSKGVVTEHLRKLGEEQSAHSS